MTRIVFNIASFIFLFFLLTSTALAIPSADYSLSEVWDGSFWNYNLTITNTSTDDESLYSFALVFPEEISFKGIALPLGWDGVTWMGALITSSPDAYSTDPAYDIVPFATLGGFLFQTDRSLSALDFTYETWGAVTEPSTPVIPEPSTWALFLLGLTGVVIMRRRERRL